jgi:hypothetical protein
MASNSYRSNYMVVLLAMIVMFVGAFFVLWAQATNLRVPIGTSSNVIDMDGLDHPLSNHAKKSHADEKWNAYTISKFFMAGKCTPKKYSCAPKFDFRVEYCSLTNSRGKVVLEIGRLIGLSKDIIITGYEAEVGKWSLPGNVCR